MLFANAKDICDKLREHVGHDLVITEYLHAFETCAEVAIECETCYEVLLSFMDEENNKEE